MKSFRYLSFFSACAVFVTSASLLLTVGISAQGRGAPAPAANAPVPNDLSGFWELRTDTQKVPAAALAARVTPAVLRAQAQKNAHAIRWCNYMGMPWAMYGTQRPLNIVQGAIETVIVPESGIAFARHIYVDGRTPSEDALEPSTNGFSTGRWEGSTFVVTTVAFSDKGSVVIPGGGFRTEQSRLTERFRLALGGAQLWVTSTWEDKTMFRSPHTYEMRYQRVVGDYRPRAPIPCDSLDDERAQFLGFKPIGTAVAAPAPGRARGPAGQ